MTKELAEFILNACENSDTFFKDEVMPEMRVSVVYIGNDDYGIVCANSMPVMAAVACECLDSPNEDGMTINGTYYECMDMELLAEIRHLKIETNFTQHHKTLIY